MKSRGWTQDELVTGVLAGDRRALARSISLVEDGEADAVAEQRATSERARRVDGDDTDAPAEAARMPDEGADQR